jgi:hypothetical protein
MEARMQNAALITAGCVFLFVAILHLIRLRLQIKITVKEYVLPMWLSIIGCPVVLALALWMFKAVQ